MIKYHKESVFQEFAYLKFNKNCFAVEDIVTQCQCILRKNT